MGVARKHNPGSKPGPRFAFENLEMALLGGDHLTRQSSGSNTRLNEKQVMPKYIARATNTHTSIVHRWKREGLTFYAADKAAIAIGHHPSTIWPDWESRGIDFYGK